MQEDARRLRNKAGDDGELTSGQAAALLNTEKGIDLLREQLEDLEETLQARRPSSCQMQRPREVRKGVV